MSDILLTSIVPESLDGQRFDQALAKLFEQYSREMLKNQIVLGRAHLNNVSAKPRAKVQVGDVLTLATAEITLVDNTIIPQKIEFEIVSETLDFIIVNKPAGLVVHPGAGNHDQTLANGLVEKYPELSMLPRAGLVHRIDKDTSGLLLVARQQHSYTSLNESMAARKIKRVYEAVVNGVPISGGTVNAPIARDHRQRTKMRIAPSGRNAVSHFTILEKFRRHSLLEVRLETGRTHQIRVHMSSLGHTLVGDTTYGARPIVPKNCDENLKDTIRAFKRQALHAKQLEFFYPSSDQLQTFTANPPDDFGHLISELRCDVQRQAT